MQHSQVAAELPVLLGAGDAGLLLVLSCLTSCPMSRAAIQNGAFPSGWEEQLSLGNVKEGMWVQTASCSQHLCLMF